MPSKMGSPKDDKQKDTNAEVDSMTKLDLGTATAVTNIVADVDSVANKWGRQQDN